MPEHDQKENGDLRHKQISVGLTLSGVLIGISFIAMIIPLALFHAAQVAATLRLRTSVFLLVVVIVGILGLGIIGRHEMLLVGGMMGTLWFPIFVFVLFMRQGQRPMPLCALALCVPAFLLLSLSFSIPAHTNFDSYLDSRFHEAVTQQQAAGLDPRNFTAWWNEVFREFRSQGAVYSETVKFFNFDESQRLSWFVYGPGAAYFFGLLITAFASLVFLDIAFDQVEKFRAVVAYVLPHAQAFPAPIVQDLSATGLARRSLVYKTRHFVRVTGHSKFNVPGDEGIPFWKRLVRPAYESHVLPVRGYLFDLEFTSQRWNLRAFALPLPVVLIALLFLGSVMLWKKSPDQIILASGDRYGLLLSVGGVLAFGIICVVAVQGIMALFQRLSPGLLVVLFLAAILVGSYASIAPHLLLGIFGIIGLMDYAYDFRGRLAKEREAV